ncbi:MAG: ABC transporter permease subunit [Terriglobia bacterium]
MAVYKRTYHSYAGPLTNPLWRFLVLQRFAFKAVMKSRFLLIGYLACFIAPVLIICMLYLNQNASILAMVKQKPGFLNIDGRYFFNFLNFQAVCAGLLTAFVGPTLVAPDLANGALPMYLSRSLSRAEYILGKGMVLGAIISSITLAPLLLMFAVQSSLVGYAWFIDNFYLFNAIVVASLLVMSVFILLGLAMSAWVRWRIVAGALVLGSFVAGKGFGAVINGVMRTEKGYYLDLQHLLSSVGGSLFHNAAADEPISALAAFITLMIFCVGLLLLINRKLRVCEAA